MEISFYENLTCKKICNLNFSENQKLFKTISKKTSIGVLFQKLLCSIELNEPPFECYQTFLYSRELNELRIHSHTSLGMTVNQQNHTNPNLDTVFYIIAWNNCCSYIMFNNNSDFKGDLTTCSDNIKGIGGINRNTKCRTVSCTIKNDEGKPHELVISGAYYNPTLPY